MKVRSEIMYPEYKLIQIVELPENGKNKYAIQYIAHMEYFDFDFRSKNSIKKFLSEGGYKSGEYLIIVDNEEYGDRYITVAVCVYRDKEQGNFLEFKLAGKEWKNLVREVVEQPPVIDVKLDIQTMHKVSVPKVIPE